MFHDLPKSIFGIDTDTIINVYACLGVIILFSSLWFIMIQIFCPRFRLKSWEPGYRDEDEEDDEDSDDDYDNQDFDIERQFLINRRKKEREIYQKLRENGLL
ncbi:hypothetical protein B9Z55_015666 [Caenorhabditis nigoni]|uniref:Uncharacterized protein n=1 Tax=Caenorhabditis nigoni TaxID=1611254 RepID=A0A2G5UBA6_9PELO|nr:hypothetical protein B9Z55_015666 [Caenorhabditis nigoni]